MTDNRAEIENMLIAIGEGGDQVKSFDNALQKAGDISAKVYNEKDGNYWVKYYRGVQQSDKQGMIVNLGGSRASNLGDNLELFGLNPGSVNVYASVYKVFGDIDVKLYPDLIPSYPAFNEVVDLTFINDIKDKTGSNITNADKVKFNSDVTITNTVSKRAWTIEFQSGSANFTSQTLSTLDDLYNQLIVASGLSIEVVGYTDNTGTPDGNMSLSQQRAEAVKNWLIQKSSTNFPANRFAKVEGRGQNNPIADNNSSSGKSKNRRVEIALGK
jgi:outer membrane protein OmpA-like peptidoglycan-associated protein